MPYLGQSPSKGDENNFKILDDISSYTLTFDGSDASVVSAANDTITSLNHRFVQGQRVTYNKGGGTVITGLSDGVYYVIKHDHNTIKLATSASNATNGTAVNITNVGGGSSHTLNAAFDGINTKFKATHTNGQKAKITRSAQLVISVNGVIQQPHDSATPSTGFGFDLDGTIVLSQAPVAGDVYWAHVLTNNNVTFDISDNDVDNFTGNGSQVSFNLSKTPPDNRNVLVTIDGVVQYPNDPDGTVRAYTVVENVLTFVTAPDANVQIQVRHIGFAGSTSGSGGVTNFYGRTGAVVLKNTDNIVANNAEFAGNLTVQGTMTTLDTKVTEVDQLEVAANNTTVGVAITQSGSGDILNLYDGSTEVFSVADGGNVTSTGDLIISSSLPRITLNDTNHESDFDIKNENGSFRIRDLDNPTDRYRINSSGTIHEFFGAADFNSHLTLDGNLYIADSIIHSGDTDAKIRFPAADTITAETSGNERFRIDSNGNVHIGTAANPGNDLRYVDIGNYNTGSSAGSILRLITTESDGTDTASADIVKYKAGGLVINNNEKIGTAGYISFGTATGGGSTTERFRIESDGNIKAKTGTQYKGFTLVKADGGTVAQLVGHGSDNDEGGLNLWDGTTKKVQILSNGNSYFTGGDVGIGTLSPREGNILDIFSPSSLPTDDNASVGIANTDNKTYPTSSSFAVTVGLKQKIEIGGTQTIDPTTPGGYNYISGITNQLIKNRGNTQDIERSYYYGINQSLTWSDSNTLKQYISINDNLSYFGKDANGRTSSSIRVRSLTLNPGSGNTQTHSNIESVNPILRSTSGTSTINITNMRGYVPTGFRSVASSGATLNGTATNVAFYDTSSFWGTSGAGTNAYTITNLYGLILRQPNSSTGLTVTNNYGIYQEWSSAKNYFAGNVGINTITPSTPLEIYTPRSAAWKFRIKTDVSDGAGFYQRANGDFECVLRDVSNNNNFISGNSGGLEFATSGAEKLRITAGGTALFGTTATVNSLRAVFQGYSDGGENFQARIRFQSNQATNLTSGSHIANLLFTNASGSEGARIDVKADSNWGTGSYPSRIEFSTTASSANTPTERLRIASDGATKVCHNGGAFGVGGDPINKFGITASDNNFFGLHRSNASTGTGEFNINVEANSQVTFSMDDEGAFSFGTTTDPSAQSSYAEKFRIDNKGNLKTGTVPSALNFTDSNSGATRFIEIGSNQGDALLVTHASGYGVGYFGYERGGDRLVIACDNGGGGNKIDFIPNAGTTTGGGTDNLGGKAPNMRLIPDGSLYAGGTIVLESDMNWTHDTYQRPHIFSGVTGGNPSDGVVVVASPETNPSNTRVGAIVFGCKTSSTTGVSNSGLKAVIDCYTNSNVSDAWKTGASINFSVRRDNGELENKFQVTKDGVVVRRQDSANEGGELMLCRPSDNTPHFHIDAFGASGATPSNSNDWVNNVNPTMRIHTGGTEIFKIGTNGNIRLPHNPIFCGVYQDGNSTNVNSDPVIFNDTVYINKGAGQTGSGTPYNTSNGYFTCPSGGYYQVYVQAHLQDQSGTYSTWRIYHNTTIVSNAWEGDTGGGSLVASVIVNVAGGDTLRATFVSSDTTQYTNETYWVLHILKVG